MMNAILTQFRRELWEYRGSFIWTPLILAALFLGLTIFSSAAIQFNNNLYEMSFSVNLDLDSNDSTPAGPDNVIKPDDAIEPGKAIDEEARQTLGDALRSGEHFAKHPGIIEKVLAVMHSLFVTVLSLVLPWYLLGCLYNDRRDQSVLFWKSLPVNERRNVLTKLGTAALVAPLSYLAAAVLSTLILLAGLWVYGGLVLSMPLPSPGEILGAYLRSVAGLLSGWLLLALWLLPLFTWLLFSSALARRAPFLIATGAPLGLMLLERLALGSTHLFTAAINQIGMAWRSFMEMALEPHRMTEFVQRSLAEPTLWIGILISVVLVVASICLRNYRYEV